MSLFSDQAALAAMLEVEIALAASEAEVGLMPSACAEAIARAARAEAFDLASLRADAERAGNIAIPVIDRLTALVEAVDPVAARYVHLGATSQDVLDTALVLQLRNAAAIVDADLERTIAACAALARRHATDPMPGRTWLQQASPVTFGLKAAGWLDLVARCRERARDAFARAMVVQLGGASGTLAALGAAGPEVIAALARRLSLGQPDMPWHTQRDRLVDVGCALGLTCGALGKIGRDLTLLAQTEVAEAAETPGAQGRSSSMPHKQNPVHAVRAVAAATRAPGLVATLLAAMPQEHERAAGGWQAEWETLPELVRVTIDSGRATATALEHLQVSASRMRRNLETQGGVALAEALSVALTARVGRRDAMAAVARASRAAMESQSSLAEAAAAEPLIARQFTPDELGRLLEPDRFLGSAATFIDRVLRKWSA